VTEDDKLLEKEQIEVYTVIGPDSSADSDGSDSPGGDPAAPDKNITGPHGTSAGADEEKEATGGSGNDPEQKGSKRHGKSKTAKKTSRKELLELINKKNELLNEMEMRLQIQDQELKNKEDRLIRMAAEFENYKKRTRREWELLNQRAKAELITDILGVLDDFDRALKALGERDDHVADGVKLIVTSLKDVLSRAGLSEVEALGQPFDPQFHEAVGEIDSDEVEDGAVVEIVQKGYQLNNILIRPAKVIVSKKK
jgi:molecular chaperone GrpE